MFFFGISECKFIRSSMLYQIFVSLLSLVFAEVKFKVSNKLMQSLFKFFVIFIDLAPFFSCLPSFFFLVFKTSLESRWISIVTFFKLGHLVAFIWDLLFFFLDFLFLFFLHLGFLVLFINLILNLLLGLALPCGRRLLVLLSSCLRRQFFWFAFLSWVWWMFWLLLLATLFAFLAIVVKTTFTSFDGSTYLEFFCINKCITFCVLVHLWL